MKKKKWIIAATILSVVIVSTVVLLLVFRKDKIELNKYLEIEIDGYDTVGKASYFIDYDSLYEDYEEVFEKKSGSDIGMLIELLGTEMFLRENIDGKLLKDSALCNGDTVEFIWNVNKEKLEKVYKAKFIYKNTKKKVSGLEEGTSFDPFKELDVSFSGTSPNGKVQVDEKFSVNGLIAFVDKSNGLKNGDTVTVTIKGQYGADVYELCFNEGLIPTTVEKKYTVSGLTSYVEKLSEITPKSIAEMDSQARDVLKAYVAENWIEKDSLLEMELLGQYFLSLKPGFETSGNHNEIILVYRNTVANSEGKFSYYYYTAYSPIMSDKDGVISCNLGDYIVPEEDGWFTEGTTFRRGSYYYVGYETLAELFDDLVQKYVGDYTYETNITDACEEESKELFILEKGEFLFKKMLNGEDASELLEESFYADEILNRANEFWAEYYEQKGEYVNAYQYYDLVGNTEKSEEQIRKICDMLEELSTKDAYDAISAIDGAGITDDKYMEIKEVYLKEQFEKAGIGDVVMFGDYEQDANSNNGLEPIEWIVLEKTDTTVKLLSKYMIEFRVFKDSWGDDVTRWDTSDLRKFLNDEFSVTAFSEEELQCLVTSVVKAERNPNPIIYDNYPGEDTEDKVYILSYKEYMKYKPIKDVSLYSCTKTIEAKDDVFTREMWLRTSSSRTDDTMAVVYYDGRVSLYDGFVAGYTYARSERCVRPVITVDISGK